MREELRNMRELITTHPNPIDAAHPYYRCEHCGGESYVRDKILHSVDCLFGISERLYKIERDLARMSHVLEVIHLKTELKP